MSLFGNIPGLGNLQEILQMGQQMQTRMAEAQENLARMEVSASSGGGMVTVTVDGKATVRKLAIDRSVVSADDVEMLEDLILAALGEAQSKARALAEEEMGKVTGGLPLPFKLPGFP